MNEIKINVGRRVSRILMGRNLLAQTGELVAGLTPGRKALLVTNAVVEPLYAHLVADSLRRAGRETVLLVLPDGEQTKTLAWAQQLYDRALDSGLDRSCPVLALGGGVVGDLAGFVAATYLRGVPLVQIPTTLLAQVDSSVGGKVAVNHPRAKNIIGAFYQPGLVLADNTVFTTLAQREIRSGLAEVIKYGVIHDAGFFAWLEQKLPAVLALEEAALARAVATSCGIKAAVVEKDEREQGCRVMLNYGHTLGHALEAVTDYGVFRHGEAVAVGMVFAAWLAAELGRLDSGAAQRIEALIGQAGLPTRIPAEIDLRELLAAMAKDKKTYHGRTAFVLPCSIGTAFADADLSRETLLQALTLCRAS